LKRLSTFYPILLAIFPILSFFGHNIEEVPATDLLLPLLVVVAGTLALLLLSRLVIKNHNKVALVVAWLIVLFFSYGYVRDIVFTNATVNFKPNIIPLSMWLVLFVVGVFLMLRTKRDFAVVTKFSRVVAVALVIVASVYIGVGKLNTPSFAYENTNNGGNIPTLTDIADPPDIYYIILDMYAREDTLKKLFDYDNTEFIDHLVNKGFYVANKSHSNYTTTYHSISASLNMSYESQGDTYVDMYKRMANSKVSQLLKSAGYRYIYVTGGVPLNSMEKHAVVYSYSGIFGVEVSDFTQKLCDTTLLSPLARYFGGLYGANSVLYAFDTLAKIPDIEEPTFVYSHILCPHPPWFFTADGPRDPSLFGSEQDEMIEEGYLGNLEFVNREVGTLVDVLLTNSDAPPIIILQGDHGPGWVEEQIQHHEILNAYYLPGVNDKLLYETISSVNSFRVVLNNYFDTDYELLKDCMFRADGSILSRLEVK